MDIKHVLFMQPVDSVVRRRAASPSAAGAPGAHVVDVRRRPRRGRARTATGVRVRQRVAAARRVPRAVPHRRPARHRGRVARVHRRRRVPPAGALALRRLVRRAGATAGTRRCTGATTAPTAGRVFTLGGWRPVDPERAGRAREPLRSRRVRALARRAPAHRVRVGARGRVRRTRRRTARDHAGAAPLHPSPHPPNRGSRRRSARCGSGRRARTCPIRVSPPRPVPSVSTTASS